jgi:hypothetical protein
MNDTRTAAVLAGAVVVVLALFAPWYAIDLSGPVRDALGQQTGQLPGVVAEVARGMLAALPDRIEANAWEIFEKTDVVLLCCAIAAAFAALLRRLDVAWLAGAAAVATTLVAIVDKPGPGGDLVQRQWGPWVALAGAGLIVLAARRPAHPEPAVALQPWPAPVAVAPVAERTASVAPPAEPAA